MVGEGDENNAKTVAYDAIKEELQPELHPVKSSKLYLLSGLRYL